VTYEGAKEGVTVAKKRERAHTLLLNGYRVLTRVYGTPHSHHSQRLNVMSHNTHKNDVYHQRAYMLYLSRRFPPRSARFLDSLQTTPPLQCDLYDLIPSFPLILSPSQVPLFPLPHWSYLMSSRKPHPSLCLTLIILSHDVFFVTSFSCSSFT
jgi:hypothetical protein